MRATWIVIGMMTLATGSALAQPGPGAGPRGFGPPGGPQGMLDRLAERLELRPEQREAFDEIAAGYLAEWESMAGRGEEMRALAQEMRAAREAGDEARVAEVRAQMRDLGGGRREMMQSFLADVETILDPAQVDTLHQLRAERERRRGRMRGGNVMRVARMLPDRLGLSEEQRAAYDEVVERMLPTREEMMEHWAQMRPLIGEIREARRNGDDARVAELEQELQALRPDLPELETFLAEIQPLLTDAQREQLAELRSRMDGGREPERMPTVEEIGRAVRRLDLTDAQEDQIKEIMRDVQGAERYTRRDREAQQELARSFQQKVMGVLDAEQQAALAQMLERQDGRRGGPRERARERSERRGGRERLRD